MKKEWTLHVITVAAFALFIALGLACGSSEPAVRNNSSNNITSPVNAPVVSGPDDLDMTLREASDYLNESVPRGKKVAFLNIQSDSAALAEYIIDVLIANAVNDKFFSVVDRHQLDAARAELNFNMSGEVSDKSAQAVGQMIGAQTIISGKVSPIGERYRLNIRALEVETVQVQGSNNWNMAAGKTITDLLKSGGASVVVQSSPARATGSSSSTTTSTSGTPAKPIPSVTSVSVSPDSVSVDKGKTQQFIATITGTNNPDPSIIWTVTDNTSSKTSISEEGVLTVGNDENITPLTVTATSTADKSKRGSATVAVPGGIPALSVNSIASWNSAINKIRNGGDNQTYIINVTGNVPVAVINENLFGSVTGLTVTIQGGGALSISNSTGSLIRIGARQTVVARNITLRGHSNNSGAVVRIESGGAFRMEDGCTISGNRNNYDYGGGVHINGGTFTMQGGTISGNTAAWGGGVYVSSGTFTMQGGTISGNTASSYGGGVFINGGTFTMQGGTISGNTASNYGGGGVFVNNNGRFTMQGGAISGNTSSNRGGGGVYVDNGTFTKIGGIIYGNDASQSLSNTAKERGQAVYSGSGDRWRNATAGPDDRTDGYGFYMND